MNFKATLKEITRDLKGGICVEVSPETNGARDAEKMIAEINNIAANAKNGLKITIEAWHEQRSMSANAYCHVLFDKIAQATHKSLEDVKHSLVLDYGTIMRDSKGNKVGIKLPATVNVEDIYKYAKWFDERTEGGVKFNCYIIYKPTHTLDSKEMARLIDGVVQEAQNLGIETRTPEQIAEMISLMERENAINNSKK